jgi:D-aminopeptidase
VGRELGRSGVTRGGARGGAPGGRAGGGDGSIIIVVATDAPLSDRNLRRLAARAVMGLARTGSPAENGSGDYVIAFSTNASVRRARDARRLTTTELGNEEMNPLFQAAVEATEEAIYDALFTATTVEGNGNRVEAIPLDEVKRILRKYGR